MGTTHGNTWGQARCEVLGTSVFVNRLRSDYFRLLLRTILVQEGQDALEALEHAGAAGAAFVDVAVATVDLKDELKNDAGSDVVHVKLKN